MFKTGSMTIAFLLTNLLAYAKDSPATTNKVAPGEYLAERGRGTLLITARKKGQYLKINTYGGNGHTCSIEGDLDAKNQLKDKNQSSEAPCIITLDAHDDRIKVSTNNETDACESYCGVRARLDDSFYKVDDICKGKTKTKNIKLFNSYYSKKSYQLAEQTMRSAYEKCGKYLYLAEKMRWMNDLAVTYKNLKEKEKCLTLIKTFLEDSDLPEEEALDLAPSDEERVGPEFKKLKFNRNACKELED